MSNITGITGRQHKQAGMVAIMVTLILMIVISLIVLGFAQISRRNQRQALDRQLSTQAFYAAETGVNDAAVLINAAVASGQPVADKPDCASNGGGFYTLNPIIDSGNDIEYTCLTVDPTPGSLVKGSIGTRGTIIPLIAESGVIDTVTLKWFSTETTNATPAANCPSTKGTFPPSGQAPWGSCGYGVLRFDLVRTDGAALSMAGLQSNTMTSFVVPLRPSGSGNVASVGYSSSLNGANNLLGVLCSNTECSLTINAMGQSQYYMRVSSLYKDVALQITGTNASGAVNFTGAQAVIDATGKAQDVLRRVQVRIPLFGTGVNLLSDYAVQSSEALCKRFSVMDGYFQSNANASVAGVGASTSNPLCQ